METTEIKITGMVCDACSAHVESALKGVPGVASVQVDRTGGRAIVEHTQVRDEDLTAAVREAGYEAEIPRGRS